MYNELETIKAQIDAETTIKSLSRQHFGIREEAHTHLRIVRLQDANVDEERLTELIMSKAFTPGQHHEMVERRKELERWYTEVIGVERFISAEAFNPRINEKQILEDVRLHGWGEPRNAKERKMLKYANINALKFKKECDDRDRSYDIKYSFNSDMAELLRECTLKELEVIEYDAEQAILRLNGIWSSMKYLKRTPAKVEKYETLKKQYGLCYTTLRLIEQEQHNRDKQREKEQCWGTDYDGHQLDADPVHHERDAYRMRLHHWAARQERIA